MKRKLTLPVKLLYNIYVRDIIKETFCSIQFIENGVLHRFSIYGYTYIHIYGVLLSQY